MVRNAPHLNALRHYSTSFSEVAQSVIICNTPGMVNRMRATRSHRDNRRSHHALDDGRFSKCADCGAAHESHKICMSCGHYNGHKVLDLAAKAARRAKKAADAAKK